MYYSIIQSFSNGGSQNRLPLENVTGARPARKTSFALPMANNNRYFDPADTSELIFLIRITRLILLHKYLVILQRSRLRKGETLQRAAVRAPHSMLRVVEKVAENRSKKQKSEKRNIETTKRKMEKGRFPVLYLCDTGKLMSFSSDQFRPVVIRVLPHGNIK